MIECCCWSKVAHSFDEIDEADPIIVFKGCRVTEFQGGWQLTMDHDATYLLNPDLPRAKELRTWFSSIEKSSLRPMNQRN